VCFVCGHKEMVNAAFTYRGSVYCIAIWAIQTVQGQVMDLCPSAICFKYSGILRAMSNGILDFVHLWPFNLPWGSHLGDAG